MSTYQDTEAEPPPSQGNSSPQLPANETATGCRYCDAPVTGQGDLCTACDREREEWVDEQEAQWLRPVRDEGGAVLYHE